MRKLIIFHYNISVIMIGIFKILLHTVIDLEMRKHRKWEKGETICQSERMYYEVHNMDCGYRKR